jgi:hypothetical protein
MPARIITIEAAKPIAICSSNGTVKKPPSVIVAVRPAEVS